MNILRVWAPNANRVAALIAQRRFEMGKEGGEARGWWRVSAPEVIGDIDYAFVIDNEEKPLPDPRTRFQPYGIHGASRIVDHGEFKGPTSISPRRRCQMPRSTNFTLAPSRSAVHLTRRSSISIIWRSLQSLMSS
jgi:1,4-alpha-glucan branching enzyme